MGRIWDWPAWNWRKSKPQEDVIPVHKPVSLRDGEEAIRWLRENTAVDVEAYAQAIDPAEVFSQRLGPTPDCLTLDRLEVFAATTAEIQVGGATTAHVATCEDCRRLVQLYSAVKARSLREAPSEDLLPDPVFALCQPIELKWAPVTFEMDFTGFGERVAAVSVSSGIFSEITVDELVWRGGDPVQGAQYVLRCTGRPARSRLTGLSPEAMSIDWAEVRGQTLSGGTFTQRTLLPFRMPRL